ncbi:hypothetical protein, partial [Azospirillum isscasi]
SRDMVPLVAAIRLISKQWKPSRAARMRRADDLRRTGFQVIAARLDEQRQTIHAMIPTRIAAVGRADTP